ncbi:MAG: signal peptide peptidase SppA [Spirochaetia bacterium]
MLQIRKLGLIFLLCVFSFTGCLISFPSKTLNTGLVPSSSKALLLRISGPLIENENTNLSLSFKSNINESGTLVRQLLTTLEHANEDKNIEVILLSLSKMKASSMPAVVELQQALQRSKKAGKVIYAYSESYTMSSFLLASVADKIWMDPFGDVALDGLAVSMPFFRRAMEKYGLRAYVARVGRYKSAIEPFTLYEMSNDVQSEMMGILANQWDNYLELVSLGNRFTRAQVASYSENRPQLFAAANGDGAKLAMQQKLIDHIGTSQDFREGLKEIGYDGWTEHTAYLSEVSQKNSQKRKINTPYVTVIYAIGAITRNGQEPTDINAEALAQQIYTVRNNPKTKALVIRVDSPGGEVFASEIIAREIAQASEKMPVIISMGGVAASGAYWFSLAGTELWAEKTSITGSIGVFSLLVNASNLLNTHGITYQELKTHTQAGRISPMGSAPNAEQMKMTQESVEFIYGKFLQRLVDAKRFQTLAQADAVGQGRVYTGSQALAVGLVDRLGSLEDALKRAAELAELPEYTVVVYSPQQSLLSRMIRLIRSQTASMFTRNIFDIPIGEGIDLESNKTYAMNSFVVILP